MAEYRDSAEPSESRAVPVPPRFWWLKRVSIGVAVFLALLVGVRVWWGHVAEQRLQATIAEYRAAGQPVTLEDFRAWMTALPDEENGAHFLQQAISSMKPLSHGYIEASDLLASPELRADLRTEMRRLLDDNAHALAQVRKARGLPASDWKIKLTSPVMSIFPPHLSAARLLAKTTILAGLYHHAHGNDREALESATDVLAVARHVGYRQPFFTAQLVSVAIESLCCTSLLEPLTVDLMVSDSPSDDPTGAPPATRTQVRQLINDLLADDDRRERFVVGMYGERLQLLDLVDSLVRGGLAIFGPITRAAAPANKPLALLLSPAWKLDAVRMMNHCTVYAEAAAASSGSEIQALPEFQPAGSTPEVVARFVSAICIACYKDGLTHYYFCMSLRRMAATALALRLYELDHGHRPASLAALVPDYLPAVPADPFDPAGRPIRYAPDIASPRLYSIGPDGVDDGGDFIVESGRIKAREKDIPFFLNGDRPVPPPPSLDEWEQWNLGASSAPASSQAVENGQGIEHGPWQDDGQQQKPDVQEIDQEDTW